MTEYHDVADWTADSESHPRTSKVDTLQVHHSTVISRAAARSLYNPGGRQVSPNGQLDNGVLYGIVRNTRRAFTSGSPAQDQRSYTVETDNLTLGPSWIIGTPNHDRLALLMVQMFKAGDLRGFFYGQGGLLFHRDVPGSYATACPGPDMNATYIIEKAKQIYSGASSTKKGMPMRIVHEIDATKTKNLNFWAVTDTDAWIITREEERILTLAFFASALDVEGNFARMQTSEILAVQAHLRAHAPAGGGGGGGVSAAQIQAMLDKADDAMLAAIAKLDTQSDTYQADLKAELAKGLTGTITLK